MTITSFDELNFRPEIRQALKTEGYTTPTPIQAQAIPAVLDGMDVLGLAQTGTGKTAAFTLPMLERLTRDMTSRRVPRALILAPTRELAIQISDSIRRYGAGLKLYHTQIVGGASQNRQVEALKRGVDIVVATPGRLEDLMQQRLIDISKIEIFVLDEADRMLEIGFMPSIRRITAALPQKKQTLFFSATMPRDVADLAKGLLHNPLRIEVAPVSTPIERISQQVVLVGMQEKKQVLVDLMLDPAFERSIIFTRTKHGADKVARILEHAGIQTSVMHGRKSQNQRQNALGAFGRGMVRAMVATDIAARGIDVDDVTHVINYDIPHEPETYVHRIGRTARAGKSGMAISLCDPQGEERGWLRQIERLTRMTIPVVPRPVSSGYTVPPPQQNSNGRPPRSNPQQSRGRFDSPRSEQQQGQRPARGRNDQQQRHARPRIEKDVFVDQPGDKRREPGQRSSGPIKPFGSENAGNDNRAARPAKKPFWKQRKEHNEKQQNRGSFGRPNRSTGS